MAGTNPAWMAKQLGHGLDVFFRDYADWINGQQDTHELLKIEAQIAQFFPNSSPRSQNTA
jgi:integrase